MQLIGQYDSPFVRRVGVALMRYGMDFDHVPFSVMGDGEKFAQFNPLKRVPTLVLDSGEVLTESGAILDYLDETHGRNRALIAQDGRARRAALQRIALATAIADKAVAYFYTKRFGGEVDPWFAARCEEQIITGLHALNIHCADRHGNWWFGADPGHDDIAVACVARFLSEAYAPLVRLSDYPDLEDHSRRAENLSEFIQIQQPFLAPA
ncbi:glutathione S-transferase family protein [Novosphingobium umbonatum]|uniref:Glutathione S-transferase family protein n=1 Tax=Novosphingobium umbonatum TaxID=1908524 RepID=A0A437N1P4_9SPHN|nr:glutathione S-transferase family protein [Novosphingobium umbonatum]RVU03825.1 glutathione S-transferase family protein [Novosphingobium umbonatum]